MRTFPMTSRSIPLAFTLFALIALPACQQNAPTMKNDAEAVTLSAPQSAQGPTPRKVPSS